MYDVHVLLMIPRVTWNNQWLSQESRVVCLVAASCKHETSSAIDPISFFHVSLAFKEALHFF